MFLNTVKEVLTKAAQNKVKSSFLIWGKHGIGKTSIVPQVAKTLGYRYRNFRAAQVDPTDIIGFPTKIKKEISLLGENGETIKVEQEVMTYAFPEWFHQARQGNFILFLDEVNRAKPDVQNALFELVQERSLGGVELPDTVLIVAGNNPASKKYSTFDSDDAWMDRFIHIHAKSNFHVWTNDFALKKDDSGKTKINPEIVQFLSNDKTGLNFDFVDKDDDLSPFNVKPSPRSWEKLNELLDLPLTLDIKQELFEGIVGQEVAAALITHLREGKKPITLEQIFNLDELVRQQIHEYSKGSPVGDGSDEVHIEVSLLNQTCEDIIREENRELIKQHNDKILEFLSLIPEAMAQKTLQNLCKQPKDKDFWGKKILEELPGGSDPANPNYRWKSLVKNLKELYNARTSIKSSLKSK